MTSFPFHVKTADDRFSEIKKERDIRDLEQQAKGIENAANDYTYSVDATMVYVADLYCRADELRNQAKALKEAR
jgi:hypothetical protein